MNILKIYSTLDRHRVNQRNEERRNKNRYLKPLSTGLYIGHYISNSFKINIGIISTLECSCIIYTSPQNIMPFLMRELF